MKNVKIIIATHKKYQMPKDEIYLPVQVGKEGKEFLGYQTDNQGNNISSKNSYYCELTGLYWAWKNYSDLGNPDFIGLMHYRRHFYFNKIFDSSAYFECNKIKTPDSYINEVLGMTESKILNVLEEYDFIAATPYHKESVYQHYAEAHDIAELEAVIKIINKIPKSNKIPLISPLKIE